MAFAHIKQATIEVPDLDSLLTYWREYGGARSIVGRFVMSGQLTRTQLRRLPKALRRMLLHGKAAADYRGERTDVAELERMFRLEDPRANLQQ